MSTESPVSAPANIAPDGSYAISTSDLRTLVDHTPVIIWSCPPDADSDFHNQKFLDYIDMSAARANGLGWVERLHPDDVKAHFGAWAESLRTGQPFEVESRLQRYDGEYRWHLARGEAVRDPDGKILKWCGTNIDIEDLKRTEKALRRNEAYLAEAQRLSRTGSFIWTPSTGQMNWSEESFRTFEVEPTEEPAMTLIEAAIHPGDRPLLHSVLIRASKGEPFDVSCRICLSGARIKHIRIVGRLAEDSGGAGTYAGAFMDYTEAKQAEASLQSARAALAHVTRAVTLGELATSIAQEINQPLAGIVSSGEACVRSMNNDAFDLNEVRARVQKMVADCRLAADVVRRVRTFVRKADPDYRPLDLNETIADTLPLVQREIQEHRARLELQLDTRIPAVSGDRIQLQQVLINLIVNGLQSMKDTASGAVALTIRSERAADGGVTISVSDAGTGIAADRLQQLFEPFSSTKPDGLGMGLSVCRSIIEVHGGEIWAAQNTGSGATLSFMIPAMDAPAEWHQSL